MKGHRKPKVNKMLDDFINETFGTSEKSTPRNKSNNARNGRRGKEKVKRVSPIHISKIISPLYVSRFSFPCSPISSKFHKYRLSPQPIIPQIYPLISPYTVSLTKITTGTQTRPQTQSQSQSRIQFRRRRRRIQFHRRTGHAGPLQNLWTHLQRRPSQKTRNNLQTLKTQKGQSEAIR